MLTITSALTSAHPNAHWTAGGYGLLATWGITLTLGRPPRVPYQGAWHRNAGDWGPQSLNSRHTLLPHRHLGC